MYTKSNLADDISGGSPFRAAVESSKPEGGKGGNISCFNTRKAVRCPGQDQAGNPGYLPKVTTDISALSISVSGNSTMRTIAKADASDAQPVVNDELLAQCSTDLASRPSEPCISGNKISESDSESDDECSTTNEELLACISDSDMAIAEKQDRIPHIKHC